MRKRLILPALGLVLCSALLGGCTAPAASTGSGASESRDAAPNPYYARPTLDAGGGGGGGY